MPPTKDALKLHIKRANYQAHEWKSSLDAHHQWIDPVGKGIIYLRMFFNHFVRVYVVVYSLIVARASDCWTRF